MITISNTLEVMKEVYALPIGNDRFQKYLSKLQGGTENEIGLPIAGFNPMGKQHILDKIQQMEDLGIEEITKEVIDKLNARFDVDLSIGVNLADDLMGAWTEKYSTDYKSKFRIQGLISRGFCAPYFWTSEGLDETVIKNRISEYVFRSIYWLENSPPSSLKSHFKQEVFVALQDLRSNAKIESSSFEEIQIFYEKNRLSSEYPIIFNFFYGDEVSAKLNYPEYGISKKTGFDLARWKSAKN